MRIKSMTRNKKGQLGMETVTNVAVAFLILAVITVAIFLTLSSMKESDVAKEDKDGTMINESMLTAMNFTRGPVTLQARTNFTDYEPSCTNVVVDNQSGSIVVASGNYTLSESGCVITAADDTSLEVNSTTWNVSYSYAYRDNSKAQAISNNVSTGLTDFFGNTSTIFSILIVVIIILAITLIILAVRRFGGGSASV